MFDEVHLHFGIRGFSVGKGRVVEGGRNGS